MNTKYEIVVYWSEADGCFLAEVPELAKLITDGATRIEAIQHAEAMIVDYLKAAQAAGWSVPTPSGRLAFA